MPAVAGEHIGDRLDLGIGQQAALPPHTGFAFLARCAGTLWLALSGGTWSPCLFSDAPFYSVVLDNPDLVRAMRNGELAYTNSPACALRGGMAAGQM